MSRWLPERVEWRLSSLDDLARQLDALALPAKARLDCVIAGTLARYLIVPWDAGMQSGRSRQLFAEHCARQAYGERAAQWTLRIDVADHERPALACAIDTALLEEIGALAAQRGLQLRSVQPALMHAFNVRRASIAERDFWFVLAEPPALTLLLVEDGAPSHVKVVAGGADDVLPLVAREAFALGREGPALPVHVQTLPAPTHPGAPAHPAAPSSSSPSPSPSSSPPMARA